VGSTQDPTLGRTPDSTLVALTLDAAVRIVTPYTSGEHAQPPGGWVLAFAPEMPHAEDAQIAAQLRRRLALQDTTKRDTTRMIVTFHAPSIAADSFHVWISVGDWFSCPRAAATSQSTYEVDGTRHANGWTLSRPSQLWFSVDRACHVAPAIIDIPVPAARGRRGGYGGYGGYGRGGTRGGGGGTL
jgi:hypothetical protein